MIKSELPQSGRGSGFGVIEMKSLSYSSVYRHSCPNCGGPIPDERLGKGLVCPKCLPDDKISDNLTIEEIAEKLRAEGRLTRKYAELAELLSQSRRFEEFFTLALGSKPWGSQRSWMKRILRGDSFSIIAPTGVGKTTFGLITALFFACRFRKKSYIILPTSTLVIQSKRKLDQMMENTGCKVSVAYYHSKMRSREKKEMLERINNRDYQILITTIAFARKNVEKLGGFHLLFVDDVDAVMKSAASITALLRIAGFPPEIQEKGIQLFRLRVKIAALSQKPGKRELVDSLSQQAKKLDSEIQAYREKAASVIVSSATSRPRGIRVKLFRVLLGFDVGGRSDIGLRRVIDAYTKPEHYTDKAVVDLVKKLGDGGLVFVPIDRGVEAAEKIAEMLRGAGIRAEAYHSKKPATLLDDYEKGNIDVLVGVANYYGVLVRGLDLPWRIKYAIFAGVPRLKFSARIEEPYPTIVLRILGVLAEALEGEAREEARRYLAQLRRVARRLTPAALQMLSEKLKQGDTGAPGSPLRVLARAYQFTRMALEDPHVWTRLLEQGEVGIVSEKGTYYLLIPDPATYLQASGRTSRLYAGGITLGLSVVVVDDERVFRGLARRTRYMVDLSWTPLEELDIDDIRSRLEEERKRVLEIREIGSTLDLVKNALLIVESPNKARTISGFFGRPSIRELPGGLRAYEVATGEYILTITASGGHVFDLVTDGIKSGELPNISRWEDIHGVAVIGEGTRFVPVYTSIKRCLDCGRQFALESDRCPFCGSTRVKNTLNVIDDLRRLAWEADIVLLGTDPDTEGERISWDLYLQLRPYSQRISRLEFHEVTRKAIENALNNLRTIDRNLVDAQTVRRVEDRWIGFTLSPILWTEFWPRYCKMVLKKAEKPGKRRIMDVENCRRTLSQGVIYRNLSAGRVQTPTLGWIVDRSREASRKKKLYQITIDSAQLTLDEDRIGGEIGEALEKREATITVELLSSELVEKNPLPPFTTDAMLTEASRRLRLSVDRIMALAQNLFELGLITYHRTDSTRVSDQGIRIAREYLTETFGPEGEKLFKPRTWGEGGAHEAIRPTRPISADVLRDMVEEGLIELAQELTREHYRLYDLIFKRFIASQSIPAKIVVERYKITIDTGTSSYEEELELPVKTIEEGYLHFYSDIRLHESITPGVYKAYQVKVTKVPMAPLYTEGDVIRLMRERRIGRPSTYAKIVSTLERRRYVMPIGRQRKLRATSRGVGVYEFLMDRYGHLVSEERTRVVEAEMDKVEKGEAIRDQILYSLYNELIEAIGKDRMLKLKEVIGSTGLNGESSLNKT